MLVYRLSKKKYKDELSGYGASLSGQRWNSKGTEVIYTAQTRALASAEVAVHIPMGILPKDYFMLTINIPEKIVVQSISQEQLPYGWNAIPAMPVTQQFGDKLVVENKYAVLKVPSVTVKGEFNFILNPRHKHFPLIEIVGSEPFPFDRRLFF